MSTNTETNPKNDKANHYSEIFNELIDNIDLEAIGSSSSDLFTSETINDNFLHYLDQYCNEPFVDSLPSAVNECLPTENHTFDDSPQQATFYCPENHYQVCDNQPQILVINQSVQNINADSELKDLSHQFTGQNDKTFVHQQSIDVSSLSSMNTNLITSSSSSSSSSAALKSTSNQPNSHENSPTSTTTWILKNCDQTKKKDEDFYNKLVSVLDTDDVNKLAGELFTLEFYRSCNRLLALKSRPLANLRQTNKEAEKKHKVLIDLNKRCRSIIRKFKNGPLTIDTLFKWNEQRSLDGPMNCSICRSNKFFKRPGSIANHIYRVHGRILEEALRSGELNDVIKSQDKMKPRHMKLTLPTKFGHDQPIGKLPTLELMDSEVDHLGEADSIHHKGINFQMSFRMAASQSDSLLH